MTTYDHINDLRAELAASIDKAEHQQIAARAGVGRSEALAKRMLLFEALISD